MKYLLIDTEDGSILDNCDVIDSDVAIEVFISRGWVSGEVVAEEDRVEYKLSVIYGELYGKDEDSVKRNDDVSYMHVV